MNSSGISFSSLTNDQIEEVKALEIKLNKSHPNGQKTILIAYANPK